MENAEKVAYETEKRVRDFFKNEMSLLRENMLDKKPPGPNELEVLMWLQCIDRNVIKVALTILALFILIAVLGELQNNLRQPSMLYWLWSWVYYFFKSLYTGLWLLAIGRTIEHLTELPL